MAAPRALRHDGASDEEPVGSEPPPAVHADDEALAGNSVTVMFLRHAEAASDDPRDPNLAPSGERRTRRWTRMLAHSGITHVFSSELRRTSQTVRPLARQAGLRIEVTPARDGPKTGQGRRPDALARPKRPFLPLADDLPPSRQ